jgi:hypothetical protein
MENRHTDFNLSSIYEQKGPPQSDMRTRRATVGDEDEDIDSLINDIEGHQS